MFGLQPYRCLRGQKLLTALNLLRERHETSGAVKSLHCLGASHGQVKFSSSSTHNVEKPVSDNSQPSKETGDFGNRKSTEQLIEDIVSQDEILHFDNFQVTNQTRLKHSVWQLNHCFSAKQQAESSKSPVNLMNILPRSFGMIFNQSMNPKNPPVLREKCIKLLLTEDVDYDFTKQLLTQTCEIPHLLPLDILLDIVLRLSSSKPTELRTKTRQILVVHMVNERWQEIKSKHIVSLMYQLDDLFDMKVNYQIMHAYHKTTSKVHETGIRSEAKPNHEEGASDMTAPDNSAGIAVRSINLEKCILDEYEELKPKDLCRILTLMAKWRRRNEVLLEVITQGLCSADLSDFQDIQLTNLLFACSTLAFFNKAFLEKVSKQLLLLPPLPSSLAILALSSFSHLRWSDALLVSNYLECIMLHLPELTGQEACKALMSIANLGPASGIEQHQTVIKALGEHALACKPSNVDTVNVLWSLSILQSLDKDLVDSVLQESFVQHFRDASNFHDRSCLHKLQRISTAARYELTSYEGPFYEGDDASRDAGNVENKSRAEKALISLLYNALNKFVTVSTYVREREKLPGGYEADAFMCADAVGNLRPLSDLEKAKSGKTLHRLAIKVIPFKRVISPVQRPSGAYQMESRHLKAMGYTPVPILYSDLDSSKTVLEHVNAIQSRIKESVASTLQE